MVLPLHPVSCSLCFDSLRCLEGRSLAGRLSDASTVFVAQSIVVNRHIFCQRAPCPEARGSCAEIGRVEGFASQRQNPSNPGPSNVLWIDVIQVSGSNVAALR